MGMTAVLNIFYAPRIEGLFWRPGRHRLGRHCVVVFFWDAPGMGRFGIYE